MRQRRRLVRGSPSLDARGSRAAVLLCRSGRERRSTLAEMEARLLAWYGRLGRDLPWRHTRDPYAILVSEIMLQQ